MYELVNERGIRCQCRADIVWLEQRDLFSLLPARTTPPDERDIAVFAPEKDLFDRRFAQHTHWWGGEGDKRNDCGTDERDATRAGTRELLKEGFFLQ
jgi:hypothetical protein